MTERDAPADFDAAAGVDLVADAPIAVVVSDRAGRVEYANAAARRALHDARTLPESWRPGIQRIPDGEHRVQARDPRSGTVWDLYLRADATRVHAWGVDITRSQASDTRRRRAEELVEASPVGLFVEDAEGNTTFANRRFLDMTGLSMDAVRADGWRSAVHEVDRSVVDRLWAVAVDGQRAFRAEVRFRPIDGAVVAGYVEAVPGRASAGAAPSYLGTVTDVSYRRRIEDALRASQERYRRLLEGSHDLIQCVDSAERLLFVNDAWLQRLGYPDDALPGLTLDQIVATESLDAFRAAIHAARDQGRVVEVEGCLLDTAGASVWVEGRVASIALGDGRVDTHAFLRDVTDRREAVRALAAERERLARRVDVRTAQLTAASAELSRSSRMRDEFVAAVSHELRTPLHAILALAESLSDGVYGDLGERPAGAVDTIVESGRHLLGLINEVLDLSRIEAGRLDIDPQLHAVRELAEASVRMVTPQARDAGVAVTLRCDVPDDGLVVDGRRLRQILVNLLGNAVKFTPTGGEACLTVTREQDGAAVRFAVSDTGCGIPNERLPDIFEPFVQLEGGNTRRWDGTGLGLTLVARIAALLGGGVDVRSEPGRGSTFVVELPAVGPGAAAEAGDFSAPIVIRATTPDVDASLRRCAQVAGIPVVDDTDARPAVIFIEVQPEPTSPGWFALDALRAGPGATDVPVVAVGGVVDRSRAIARGATGFLTRPPTPSSMRRAAARALRRASAGDVAEMLAPDAPRVLLVGDTLDGLDADADLLDDGPWTLSVVSGVDDAVARALDERPAVLVAAMRTHPRGGVELAERIAALAPVLRCAVIGVTPLALDAEMLRWQQAGAHRVVARPVTRAVLARAVRDLVGSA